MFAGHRLRLGGQALGLPCMRGYKPPRLRIRFRLGELDEKMSPSEKAVLGLAHIPRERHA